MLKSVLSAENCSGTGLLLTKRVPLAHAIANTFVVCCRQFDFCQQSNCLYKEARKIFYLLLVPLTLVTSIE